jgi:hypothetical protein
MSFGNIPSELDGELARAREQELEAKAAAYAQRHPEDGDDGDAPRRPGLMTRLLRLLRVRRG